MLLLLQHKNFLEYAVDVLEMLACNDLCHFEPWSINSQDKICQRT